MKKRVLGFLALAVALCLVLGGCGGQAAQEDYRPYFTGVWELDSMVNEGEEADGDDVELLKAFGMNVFLVLNEDESCTLSLFGNVEYEGTWQAASATEASLKLADEENESMTGDLTLANDKLTMSSTSGSITFAKTTQEDMEAFLSESTSFSDLLEEDE